MVVSPARPLDLFAHQDGVIPALPSDGRWVGEWGVDTRLGGRG